MNREDKIQIGVLALAAVAVPLIVTIPLELPLWVIAAIIAALLVSVAIRAMQLKNRNEQWQALQPLTTTPPPPAPVPPAELQLSDIPVGSADQDYAFLLAGRVLWRQLPNSAGWPNVNPSALAVESVLDRAWEITSRHRAQECQLAQYRLAATLGVAARDRSGQVEAWVADVALSLSAEDERRLARLTELRKDEQLREHERAAERSARAYIANDAFATPASAIAWWLARHPDEVEEAVRLTDHLARLSAAVHGKELTAADWDRPWVWPGEADGRMLTVVPDRGDPSGTIAMSLIHQLYPDAADGSRRAALAEQLAALVSSHGRHELAEEIRAEARPAELEAAEPEDRSALA